MIEEASRVFISFASADRALAREVARGLRRRGRAVWLDEDALRVGARARAAILYALRLRPVVVFLASARSLSRAWVEAELSYAVAVKCPLLVLRVEPMGLPGWLERRTLIEVHGTFEDALDRLCGEIVRAEAREAAMRRGLAGGAPMGRKAV